MRNPGAATSADATGVRPGASAASRASSVARAVAIASGAIRYGRASFIARFVARSPCAGSAGRSISIGGAATSSGSAGSVPDAIARVQASPMAARTADRMVGARVGFDGGSVTAAMVAAPLRRRRSWDSWCADAPRLRLVVMGLVRSGAEMVLGP